MIEANQAATKRLRRLRQAAWTVGACVAVGAATMLAAPPATEPAAPSVAAGATSQPARSEQAIMADLQSNEQILQQVMEGPGTLSDATKRQSAAPKAIPALRGLLADFDELDKLHPEAKDQIAQNRDQLLATLSLFGDKQADARLDAMAKSSDIMTSLHGQSGQLMARWLGAGKDAAAQAKIAADLEKLDKAHPESQSLTVLTYTFSQGAASPALADQLNKIVTDTMDNPVASSVKEELAADAKLKANQNKPVTISGKEPDGADFSTASWKGHVILVDFWATWCGPCREELPRVKQIYSQYHSKGLELLGVSNDFDPAALKDFTAKNNMPWPELLDASAAAQQQWNPITTGFGINGIPTMFLIDKKGILRTVEARQNMEEMIPKLLAEQG